MVTNESSDLLSYFAQLCWLADVSWWTYIPRLQPNLSGF
jgi:hypothetical protein